MKISSVAYEGNGNGFVYVNGKEIAWLISSSQWEDIERILNIGEFEECPNCHEMFYALEGFDPLKQHVQYCEGPTDEDEDQETNTDDAARRRILKKFNKEEK